MASDVDLVTSDYVQLLSITITKLEHPTIHHQQKIARQTLPQLQDTLSHLFPTFVNVGSLDGITHNPVIALRNDSRDSGDIFGTNDNRQINPFTELDIQEFSNLSVIAKKFTEQGRPFAYVCTLSVKPEKVSGKFVYMIQDKECLRSFLENIPQDQLSRLIFVVKDIKHSEICLQESNGMYFEYVDYITDELTDQLHVNYPRHKLKCQIFFQGDPDVKEWLVRRFEVDICTRIDEFCRAVDGLSVSDCPKTLFLRGTLQQLRESKPQLIFETEKFFRESKANIRLWSLQYLFQSRNGDDEIPNNRPKLIYWKIDLISVREQLERHLSTELGKAASAVVLKYYDNLSEKSQNDMGLTIARHMYFAAFRQAVDKLLNPVFQDMFTDPLDGLTAVYDSVKTFIYGHDINSMEWRLEISERFYELLLRQAGSIENKLVTKAAEVIEAEITQWKYDIESNLLDIQGLVNGIKTATSKPLDRRLPWDLQKTLQCFPGVTGYGLYYRAVRLYLNPYNDKTKHHVRRAVGPVMDEHYPGYEMEITDGGAFRCVPHLHNGAKIFLGRPLNGSYATVGAFVTDDANNLYMLTAGHVALKGDPLHLHSEDGRVLGHLQWHSMYERDKYGTIIDIALGLVHKDRIDDCQPGTKGQNGRVYDVRLYEGKYQDLIGQDICKSGATTQYREGKYKGIFCLNDKSVLETSCYHILQSTLDILSNPGDSGCLVWTKQDMKAAFILSGEWTDDKKPYETDRYLCSPLHDCIEHIMETTELNLKLHSSCCIQLENDIT